jgi:cold shock CspA family protein
MGRRVFREGTCYIHYTSNEPTRQGGILTVSEDSLPLTSWNADATSVRGRATTGTITQLTHGRLCGVIRTADGQDVFFHGRDLEGARYNEMELGGAVSFELIDDRVSGARAAKIRRL